MGKKVFDFRQHTLLQGAPRSKPIIQFASDVDERSDHREDNKPKEQVLIKRTPYQGQIIDLGGEPKNDYRTDAEKNEDYWSPIGGAWERNKSQWNNGQHLLQGLGKTVGVATAVASTANPEALGVANFVQKVHNNPYVQAGMSSLGLADAAHRVKNGNVGKNFDEDVFTALEFVPYLNTAIKYGNNITKGVRDLKHLPQQVKRKWNAEKRIWERLKPLNQRIKNIANEKYEEDVYKIQQDFYQKDDALAQQQREVNIEGRNKEAALNKAYIIRERLRKPQPEPTASPLRDSQIDFSKLTRQDWEELLKQYPDLKSRIEFIEGKPYLNDGGLYGSVYSSINSTPRQIPLFGTDQFVDASITVPRGQKVPMSTFSTVNAKDEPIIPLIRDVSVSNDYIKALQHNIDYVLKEFPGAVPFGSSVGVTKAGFPHITDDIDLFITEDRLPFIEQKYGPRFGWYQKVGNKDGTGTQTYTLELENGKYGDSGKIDLNVLYADPNTGNAVGQRSLELFRQLFPDEYQKALLEAERTQSPIIINKTPEQLIAKIDPSKTILDAFESSKDKHIPRSLIYLQDGDPDQVYEGLKKYYESFLGSKVRHAPVHESQFTNYVENRQLLDQMGFSNLDNDKIASDPKRMRNIFQYWWMENTAYGRGTATDGDFFGNAKKYMTEMGGRGGQAAGPGLNTVLFGNSYSNGNGLTYGVVQPEISGIVEGMSPQEIYNAVIRSQGQDLSITPEQIQSINNILNKYNISPITGIPTYRSLVDVFDRLGYNKEGVYGVSNILGINGVVTGSYGNSLYYGGLRPFNRPGDLLSFIDTSQKIGSGIYPIPHRHRVNYIPKVGNFRSTELNRVTNPNKHSSANERNTRFLSSKESFRDLASDRIRRITSERISSIEEQRDALRQSMQKDKDVKRGELDQVYSTFDARNKKLDEILNLINNRKSHMVGIGTSLAIGGGLAGGLAALYIPEKEIWKKYLPEYSDFIDSLTPEEVEYIKKHYTRNVDWDQQKSYKQLIQELKDQKFDEKRKNKQ